MPATRRLYEIQEFEIRQVFSIHGPGRGTKSSAFASCGDSLATMALGAMLHSNPMGSIQTGGQPHKVEGNSASIVGLWHVQFIVNNQTIQEAYQVWNAGGTEIHNPNVDPRSGNVCLGVWRHDGKGAYKLAHRVWNYDSNGNFGGTIHLSEAVTVDGSGTHNGTFALDFYDPAGNFQFEVAGTVTAERITVD
jgi:hypothetical protein